MVDGFAIRIVIFGGNICFVLLISGAIRRNRISYEKIKNETLSQGMSVLFMVREGTSGLISIMFTF